MKKNTFILIAFLAIVQGVWAQSPTWIEVSNASELNSAITNGANIRLTNDITLSTYLKIGENGNTQVVTIDLNGYTLQRNGLTSAEANGHVIEVFGAGTLTLQDNSNDHTGQIKGGWADNGGGICNYGTLNIEGGTITDCKAVNGGGIMNNSGKSLTINGGSITNCRSDAGGGAIVNHGTANISGCTMNDNVATTRGGAIWSDGTLTADDCTFNSNRALAVGGDDQNEGDGGAVHVQGGTTTLNNVIITNNTSKDAGAIYVNSGAILNLSGTSILNGNTSSEHGGGGIVNQGTTKLTGSVLITGNACKTDGSGIWSNGTLEMQGDIQIKDNTYDDLYLKDGKVIIVTGTLTGGNESIGVRMQNPGIFTSGYAAHNIVTNHFFSSGTINTMGLVDGEGKMFLNYYECSWDSEEKKVVYTKCAIPEGQAVANVCTLVDPDHGGYLNGDAYWFIVNGTINLQESESSVTCAGSNVHLILCDGSSFKTDGLYVNEGTTLHIYSQSYGDRMGKLNSKNSTTSKPGIGGEEVHAGTLIIHGGDITAEGGKYAAGIGGREDKSSKDITIFGGKIDATGGVDAAGIGGGEGGSADGTILIYGGKVKATGNENAAGIGGGEYNDGGGNNKRIEIFGGTVDAKGGGGSFNDGGAGIGTGANGTQIGPIIIHGGDVTAKGGYNSAGIGGGWQSSGGTITINGGIVDANAGCKGAGIGGGDGGQGGTITINGGVVTAYARDQGSEQTCTWGAGIGGGNKGHGGTITINGGTIIANSEDGAAIGGGSSGNGGTTTITGGSVAAIALTAGAGIGGGHYGHGGTVNISGGEVMAVGGAHKLSFLDNPFSTLDHLMMCLLLSRKLSRSSSMYSGLMTEAAIQLGHAFAMSISDDKWGGAGIGGGLKGVGAHVNVTGGTVVAQGGHSGSSAIGNGYLGGATGPLYVYEGAMVSAGSDHDHYYPLAADKRETAGGDYLYVVIEPCGHRDAQNYTDNGDGTYTVEGCPHCSLTGSETLIHTFVHKGNWNDGNHWNSGHVPNPGNDIIIRSTCDIPSGYTAIADTIYNFANDTITVMEGGQLIHANEGVMAMVEKHIAPFSGAGGYYLFTNPVADELNPDSLGMTKHEYDLYWFDQSQELEWRNYKHIPFNLENGVGYLYANSNDTLLAFSGVLNRANADVNVPVTYDANAGFKGFNLVGNPFVCNAYLADGRDYYVLNAAGDEVVTATTEVIAPMQGVFVQATAGENFIGFTTTVPCKGRAVNMSVTHNHGASTGSATTVIDKARIRFGEGRNLEKFQLDPNHSKLYVSQDGKGYAVVNVEKEGEMPVNFKAKENGSYTLSLSSEEVTFSYLHLIDNMTGKDIDLLANPSYSFEAKTTDYESRFKLVFSAEGASTGSASEETFAFISNDQIILTDVDANAMLQIVDVTGRVIIQGDAMNRVSTSGMTSGVYVLRLINGNDVRTQKMVID